MIALDAILVAVGVGQHGVGRERQAVGLEHEVIGDAPRGLQVFLHQRGRHRERLGRVVEPRLVGRVDRKLLGRPQVHAGQVANRVIVFGVAQPPRGYAARVARVPRRLELADCPDPGDHAWRASAEGRCFAFAGGIDASIELFQNQLPVRRGPFATDSARREDAQIKLALRFDLRMAPETVGLEEGTNLSAKANLDRSLWLGMVFRV